MSQELMRKAVAKAMKAKPLAFNVGDTVNVSVKIVEGDKERVQVFRGTVIGRRGGGTSETFTVRRLVAGEGVERTWPVNSPNLVGIEVVRGGRTRRAKLYFLRQRVGKATRLRDENIEGAGHSAAARAAAAAHPVPQA